MTGFIIGDFTAAVDEAAATLAQTPEADRSALLAALGQRLAGSFRQKFAVELSAPGDVDALVANVLAKIQAKVAELETRAATPH